jgi:hypothetical protein
MGVGGGGGGPAKRFIPGFVGRALVPIKVMGLDR